MTPSPRGLVVSTPYRENAILALARAGARAGRLCRFYTTISTASLVGRLGVWLPLLLRRDLERRAYAGLPAHAVRTVGTTGELARIGICRLVPSRAAGSRAMHRGKAQFDHAVATQLRGNRSTGDEKIVVGMWGSSAQTFRAARERGFSTVLQFVNSHPRVWNRYLEEMAGLPPGHHELWPDSVVRAVETELEHADLVLTPSRFVAGQLSELGFPEARIAVEPYGVDLRAFFPASHRPPGPRACCLFVGHIAHRKGIRTLVEAARRLQAAPVDFTLVGPVVSPELLRALPSNVRWAGASPPGASLAARMRRADLFVLPSLEDSFGLVVLEAMASGLPVVVSDHVGASEVIEEGTNGVVVPAGDAGALARQIEQLVADPARRAALGKAARRHVEKSSSWETYAQRVLSHLDRFGALA